MLIIISGPSGVGKDAILARMKELGRPLHYTVTVTTRPRREGEADGLDYHFISQAKFQQMVENNELLEWAQVYGNLYGVPKQEVQQALANGLDVIVKVDVQGAATIKSLLPNALFIFVAPPSMEKLEERLKQRKSESAAELRLRIETAHQEMKSLPLFDYIVVNQQGQIDMVVAQIEAIITAEKCRLNPRAVEL